MKSLNKKMTRWKGLAALALMIMVCGTGEVLAQAKLKPNDCKVLKKYAGKDRVFSISVDKNNKISVTPDDGHLDFWHKDTLEWQIVTLSPHKPIKDFEIEFMEHGEYMGHPECRNDNVPDDHKKWPCKENSFGWSEGKDKADAAETISCRIRDKNVLSEYDKTTHNKKGKARAPKWNYCYVVRVNFVDDTQSTFPAKIVPLPTVHPAGKDQAGSGNGCGGCHAGARF